MNPTIDHNQLDDALKRCGSGWSAGQAHGLLCGSLVAAGSAGTAGWAAVVMESAHPDDSQVRECETLLSSLRQTTGQQLVERQSEFTLLLPDDDEQSDVRAAAMAHWCEGFLHGLVAHKQNEALKKRLAAEPLAGIIKDFLEISRASAGDDAEAAPVDPDEETEAAYSELVEYIRVAVQLAYEELAELREASVMSRPAEPDRIH